jgi:hypothetical protein
MKLEIGNSKFETNSKEERAALVEELTPETPAELRTER